VRFKAAQNAKPDADRRPAADVLGVEDAGASARGSTYYKSLLMCPREHGLTHEAGLKPESPSEPLTLGWLYHHCLEVYYGAIMEGQQAPGWAPGNPDRESSRIGMQKAYAVIEAIEAEPGYVATGASLRRMVDGYFEQYDGQDNWRIIAVEEQLVYRGGFAYSARLDLIIEDLDNGGLWIVEHKSARTITNDLIDNYQMDMQILGQVWLLNSCVDLSKYPRFMGVRVNIVTKHKEPRFARVDVCPSRYHLAAFEQSQGKWVQVRGVMQQLEWPQAFGHCSGFSRGYGKCQFFAVCHGHPRMGVSDWAAQEDPPEGFVRKKAA